MTDGHVSEEFFRFGFVEHVRLLVVAASLYEHALQQASFLGWLCDLLWRDVILEYHVKLYFIHRDVVLPCEILFHGGKEGLRKEEARDPLDGRIALFDPIDKEVDAFYEVFHP